MSTTKAATKSVYFFKDGLRHVHPYTFTHRVNAKGRWLGKPLLAALQAEFSGHTEQAWQEAIQQGRLFLERRPNSRKKRPRPAAEGADAEPCADASQPERLPFDLETVVTPSMVLVNTQLNRCEPPIPAHAIHVQRAEDGVLVIDKPVGVQVHPAGGARLNTLVHIVQHEHALPAPPKLLYRIDRVTSGLLLAATSAAGAQAAAARLADPSCTKVYLVRVSGDATATAAAVAKTAPHHDPDSSHGVTLPVPARAPSVPDAPGGAAGDTATASTDSAAAATGSDEAPSALRATQPRYRPGDFVETPGWSPADAAVTDWYRGVPRPSCQGMRRLVPPCPATVHAIETQDWSKRQWGGAAAGTCAGAGIAVRAPIAQVNSRIGLHTTHSAGKEALTELLPLWYDSASDSTVLQAVPRTGRTHQIRLHCQWLGHPVLGDEGYGWHGDAARPSQRGLHPEGGVCLHAFAYFGRGWRYQVPPAAWALPEAAQEQAAAASAAADTSAVSLVAEGSSS